MTHIFMCSDISEPISHNLSRDQHDILSCVANDVCLWWFGYFGYYFAWDDLWMSLQGSMHKFLKQSTCCPGHSNCSWYDFFILFLFFILLNLFWCVIANFLHWKFDLSCLTFGVIILLIYSNVNSPFMFFVVLLMSVFLQ